MQVTQYRLVMNTCIHLTHNTTAAQRNKAVRMTYETKECKKNTASNENGIGFN
jgi:hypothetical protein